MATATKNGGKVHAKPRSPKLILSTLTRIGKEFRANLDKMVGLSSQFHAAQAELTAWCEQNPGGKTVPKKDGAPPG